MKGNEKVIKYIEIREFHWKIVKDIQLEINSHIIYIVSEVEKEGKFILWRHD